MKKKSKKIMKVLRYLFMSMILATSCMFSNRTIHASSSVIELTPEDYTNSDQLININGTECLEDIKFFSEYIKSITNENDEILNLEKVIPTNCLYSTIEETVFYYMGREYGYYLVKEYEYFDLLLIDFEYGHSDVNSQYIIRIEQLLQVSFSRHIITENDSTIYQFYIETERPIYNIANPRFFTALENANQLNSGDDGYVQQNDSGLIIMQSRVNFTGVSYSNEQDLLEETISFTGEKILGAIDGVISGLPFVGTIYTMVKTPVEYFVHITEHGQDVINESNNENNIITTQSKSSQLNNGENYSRVFAFTPNEEIILSNSSGSYIENVLVFNETNCETKITQICDFDIVKRDGLYEEVSYVEGSGNFNDIKNTEFSFYNEDVLFIEDKCVTNGVLDYYMLPYGEDTFVYNPNYSGYYHINDFNSDVNLKVNGVDCSHTSFYLEQEQANIITLSCAYKTHGIAQIEPNEFQTGSLTLKASEKYITSYNSISSEYFKISADGFTIEVLNNYFEVISSESNFIEVYMNMNQKYYIVLTNDSTITTTANLNIETKTFSTIISNKEYSITPIANKTYIYEFSVDESNCNFDALFSGVNSMTISLMSKSTGNSIELDFGSNGMIYVCKSKNPLNSDCYYLMMTFNSLGEYSFHISLYMGTYEWCINGETISDYRIRRGQSYDISVKINNQVALDKLLLVSGNYSSEDVSLSAYNNGIYSLQIADDVNMFDDNSSANPYIELSLFSDLFGTSSYSIKLYVIYECESVNITLHQDSLTGKFSITFNDDLIGDGEYAYLVFKYRAYNVSPGSTYYSKEVLNYKNGDIISLEELSFTINQNVFQIILDRFCIFENVNGTQQSKGYTYNINYVENSSYSNVFVSGEKSSYIHYGGGNGSSSNPYLINTYRHLNNVRNLSTNSLYFKQTSNINMSSYGEWNPIDVFRGIYDGNSYSIYYIYLNVSENDKDYGLFGKVYGTIKNLKIRNVVTSVQLESDTSANRPHIGAIAGYLHTTAYITNCSVINGDFTANVFQLTCGGIVGVNFGNVSNCTSSNTTMDVSGRAGGIVGENGGTIENCVVTSLNLTHYWLANTYTGGITGWNTANGNVNDCTSSGTMTWDSPAKGDHIYPAMGKIIGRNTGNYSACSSSIVEDISYYYLIIFGAYDQSQYCFKVDNGLIGRQG